MNLRDFEYVVAVAEERHFGRASKRCHISQPTLSGQVRKLEDYLGVVLFERTNKSVRLTPVGERIVHVARDILRGANTIREIAEDHKDPTSGTLRIGLIPTIAPYLIPLIVSPLGREFSLLRPVFEEAVTEQLLSRIDEGELDVGVLATDNDSPRLTSIALYREPFWIAVPRGHSFESADTVDLRNVDIDELLLLTEGHCFRDQALAVCGKEPEGRTADMTATSLETIINLVGTGQGITLMPALALKRIRTTDLGIMMRPLNDPMAARTVRLVFRSAFPRRAALESFASVIRQALPDTVSVVGMLDRAH